jgi:undecaprenyl-diphosphatase
VSTFEAIVLGLVQGITEFLPISSTGHLRLVPALVGWDDPGTAFTAVTQLGSIVAVLLFFRRDITDITVVWLRSLRDASLRSRVEARLGWYLIVATVPLVVFGYGFRDQIETGARDLRLLAATLIALGVVLGVADRWGSQRKEIHQLNTRDGVFIGLAQSLALIPGVSRAGATLSAGLLAGYTRTDAARFSFLLAIPAIVLSGAYGLLDVADGGGPGVAATALATVVAFVSSYLTIAWLLRWLSSHSAMVFVAYRVGLGLLVFALLAAGVVDAN